MKPLKKIIIITLATIYLLLSNNSQAIASSAITGLATLKAMARQAIPYQMAIQDEKPMLLEFYADWCTSCQSLAPTLSKLHQQYREQVNFVMLNIDRPEVADRVKQFQVTGVPQITLINAAHQQEITWVGRVPEILLSQQLSSLVKSDVTLQEHR